MTTQELVKLAAEASPDLMAKTAAHLKLLEVLDPEAIPDFAEDVAKIAARVDEKTKVAFPWAKAGEWAKGVGTAAAASVAVGLGMAAATDLYNAARRGLTSGRNWKRMMSANPELKTQDVAHVRRSFKTVQKYAPDIAADPMTAGGLVFKMTNAPIGDHDRLLRDTIDLQKNHMSARYDLFKAAPKIDLPKSSPRPSARDQLDEINSARSLWTEHRVPTK